MSVSQIFLVLAVGLASLAQILLKHGMTRAVESRTGHAWLRPLREPLVLAGMATQVVLTCLWLVVLSHIDVSLAFPVLALSYGVVVAYSAFSMGEVVGKRRWCGVALIVAGVGVLAYAA
ncbi:hypothetical protein [Salinisphaera sp.]|uniref:hypothetical protein n=1 Tax=Salinisphaera sp. TaxID=1914330 RepID=UPI000C4E2E36|nr:hypothetical protein [Salinisphaera sp.]MBS63771.1 hypothetical protein [Salinisphaera sp.]